MISEKRYSILIVDDESMNISILKYILGSEYKIYASSDGEDAIEAAEEFKPDIILLDIIMPGIDGYEVLAALKTSEKTYNIPVIFISGLDSANDEEKCLALGAAGYITKPFQIGNVKLQVKKHINLIESAKENNERIDLNVLLR